MHTNREPEKRIINKLSDIKRSELMCGIIMHADLTLEKLSSKSEPKSQFYARQESCAIAKMTARCALYK